MSRLVASFFILIASISYGSLGIVAKFAYLEGVSANMLAVSQMFFGVLFFATYKAKKLKSFLSVSKKSLLILGVGGAMSALTAFCYYRSLGTLPASVAIIMLFQFAWIGLMLEVWSKKRAPTKVEIASILFCYVGTYLSVGGVDGVSQNAFFGLFLGFLSGLFFAVYIFISSTYCLDEDSQTRAFWIIFFAFASSLLLSIPWLDFTHLPQLVKWGALCGILGVVIPFYIYAVFSPAIGAGATAIIGSAELPSALILSALVLGEVISPLQLVGSALVILAVFIVFLAETKAK